MRRWPRAPHPHRRSDAGYFSALEATFVFMLFFTSIALLPSMQPPPPSPNTPMRAQLETQLQDLLLALENVPTQDAFQRTADRIVARSHQANTTEFLTHIKRTLPPGTECNLHLDNGKATRRLIGDPRPTGVESVSASHLWHPTWAYTFTLPAMQIVGNHTPLTIQGYQVSQGSLVKQLGAPLKITLQSNQGNYTAGAITSITHAASATIHATTSTGTPTWTNQTPLGFLDTKVLDLNLTTPPDPPISFKVPEGTTALESVAVPGGTSSTITLQYRNPLGILLEQALGSTPSTLTINNPLPGTWTLSTTGTMRPGYWLNLDTAAVMDPLWRNLTLTLRNTGSAPIPEGTQLRLELPTDSKVLTRTSANPHWRHQQAQGTNITAELNQSITGQTTYTLALQYAPTATDALTLLRASLGNGTHGAATILLDRFNNPSTVNWPHNPLAHRPYVNAPRATSPGVVTPWSILLPYPLLTSGPTEYVHQVDVQATEGHALFATLNALQPTSEWQLLSPSHIRWTGNQSLVPNAIQQWIFETTAPDALTSSEPWQGLPITFNNNHTFRLRDMQEPHLFHGEIPPHWRISGSQAGYEWPPYVGAGNQVNRTLGTTEIQRGLLVKGNATYTTTEFTPLTDALQALQWGYDQGSITTSKKQARIGDTIDITVNFTGLYKQVQALNNLTINATWLNTSIMVFDPAQPFVDFDHMVPSFKGTWGPPLQFTIPPPYADSALWWIETEEARLLQSPSNARIQLSVPEGALYGPSAIIVSAHSVIKDLNAPTVEVHQAYRFLTFVDVIPDSGQSSTALYWLTLECWLPDW